MSRKHARLESLLSQFARVGLVMFVPAADAVPLHRTAPEHRGGGNEEALPGHVVMTTEIVPKNAAATTAKLPRIC